MDEPGLETAVNCRHSEAVVIDIDSIELVEGPTCSVVAMDVELIEMVVDLT